MKVSNNFIIQEFITKDIHELKYPSTWFIDDRIIKIAQFMRDRFNSSMFINTWHTGSKKQYNYRGYRSFDCEVGANYSQHKFGRAFDHNFIEYSPIEIYKDIIENEQLYYDQGVRAIENIDLTPTWIHIDIRETKQDKILIVGN